MAYCTQDDIELQLDETTLIELTDDAGEGDVAAEVVTRAVADADEEIDSYLALHYSLPFDSTPNLVRKLSVDLAICHLYARRDDTMPETRAQRCKDARKLLEALGAGRAVLDVPDPAADPDGGVGVTTSKSDRAFSIGRSSDGSSGTLDNY